MKNGRKIAVEIYTRNGSTNLVVKATSWRHRDGTQKTLTRQQVYHGTALALEILNMDNGLTFSVKGGGNVDVGTHFAPDGKLDNVNLMTKDGLTVDHFSVSNGVLNPAPSSLIEKENAVAKDMEDLFAPENVRTNSPDEFVRQAQDLIEKHKDK